MNNIKKIMLDKNAIKNHEPLGIFLWALSLVFLFVTRMRDKLYQSKIKPSYKVGCKVISVGNITLGGTGKTPIALYIAKHFLNQGMQAAIHMRGYGQDETLMARHSNPDLPLIIGKDRVRAIRKYLKNKDLNILVLDDAYQHRKIRRDIDIVVVDALNPFGNGHLLPRGILREELKALKRADKIIISKVDAASRPVIELEKIIKQYNSYAPIYLMHYEVEGFYDVFKNEKVELTLLQNKKVQICSGIGNPEYFRSKIETMNIKISKEWIFDDHHHYNATDVEHIIDHAEIRQLKTILTTEKDMPKMTAFEDKWTTNGIQILYMKVKPVIKESEVFFERLHQLFTV